MFYHSTKDGIVVHLKVTPNASKNKICDVIDGTFGNKLLRIRVKATPEDGNANKELIRFLAKEWRISSFSISLLSGQTSRIKTLLIKADVENMLLGI
jgi:uncharacterized protein (TIGR00251 family)